MRKLMAFVMSAVAVIAVVGCDEGNELIGANDPNIRFLNATTTETSLRAQAGNTDIGTAVPRGMMTAETDVNPGTYDLKVYNANNQDLLHTLSGRLLETNSNYVLYMFNQSAQPDVFTARLARENEDTTAGMSEVTFVGATGVFGDVDIYMVGPGGTVGTSPMARVLTTSEDNEIFTLEPNTYSLRVFPMGTTTDAILTQNVTLAAGANYMMFFAAQGDAAPFTPVFYPYQER